ncbi:MAG: Sua5/YciO/YrdC/YwlC family protein [Phycisphaerales bacterium]
MPEVGLQYSKMNPEARTATIQRAADGLLDHQCVVMPTDTLYGLFARADDQGAGLLDSITGNPEVDGQPRMTLHVADLDVILEHLVLEAATVRRLVHRLLPGPSRLVIEQPEHAIAALCQSLSIPRGVIDDGTHIAIRIPDHPVCRQVIRNSGAACIARRLGAASWAQGENPGVDIGPIPISFESGEVPTPGIIIDDGPTLHQKGSTTITLSINGRIEVSEYGVLTERDVLNELERTILFVCTGNTCRSPMALAIARQLFNDQEREGITTHIDSAGVAASTNIPATKHAIEVIKRMGVDAGFGLEDHQSKLLTLEMIDNAEVIYTMTPSHAQGVMTMAPNSVHKVFVLDEIQGVPDPIGQEIEVYQHTADRLKELINQRFQEIRI